MKNSSFLLFFALLVAGRISGRSIADNGEERNFRTIRGISSWNFLKGRPTTTPKPIITTIKPIRHNITECKDDEEKKKDKVINFTSEHVETIESLIEFLDHLC